jgi:hemolysin III
MRGVRKEPVSPWPHAVGFVLALIGCACLVARYHGHVASLAVVCIYGCGLLIAFGASALYHALGGTGSRRYAVFRRIDHASIYALIAGTYTPVLYFGLAGVWRSASIALVWLLAAVGIASATWLTGAPRALSTSLYIALGWLAVIPAAKLYAALPHAAIFLILAGGVLYSLGGAIYATRACNFAPGRFGFHEVFHLFVLAGAAVHFAAIAFTLGGT